LQGLIRVSMRAPVLSRAADWSRLRDAAHRPPHGGISGSYSLWMANRQSLHWPRYSVSVGREGNSEDIGPPFVVIGATELQEMERREILERAASDPSKGLDRLSRGPPGRSPAFAVSNSEGANRARERRSCCRTNMASAAACCVDTSCTRQHLWCNRPTNHKELQQGKSPSERLKSLAMIAENRCTEMGHQM